MHCGFIENSNEFEQTCKILRLVLGRFAMILTNQSAKVLCFAHQIGISCLSTSAGKVILPQTCKKSGVHQ
jgi:hypothetical protein